MCHAAGKLGRFLYAAGIPEDSKQEHRLGYVLWKYKDGPFCQKAPAPGHLPFSLRC